MVSHFEGAGLGVDYARVVHNSSGGENVDEMVDGMCARMGDVVGGLWERGGVWVVLVTVVVCECGVCGGVR